MLHAQKLQSGTVARSQMAAPRPQPAATRMASLLPVAPAPAAAPVSRARVALQTRTTMRQLVALATGNGAAETSRTANPLPIVFISAEVGRRVWEVSAAFLCSPRRIPARASLLSA